MDLTYLSICLVKAISLPLHLSQRDDIYYLLLKELNAAQVLTQVANAQLLLSFLDHETSEKRALHFSESPLGVSHYISSRCCPCLDQYSIQGDNLLGERFVHISITYKTNIFTLKSTLSLPVQKVHFHPHHLYFCPDYFICYILNPVFPVSSLLF